MKLVFKKNENGDVSVTMFKGTAEAQFSYIEMIKALLAGEALDRDYDESISKEEQTQINNVLKEIEHTAIETMAEELTVLKQHTKDDYNNEIQNL